ncbi:serine hydrolase-like protein [Kryptolebias marmoratus]|uniref:Serine hydrolase like 2 n=1 Tax=Kryptolebias marmoratus TaxID=37003 RepID=A0A3Q3FYU4_KRYMA|nr:serine hydrolase-like protein [Kryptolebias marmoratus]
MIQALKSVRHVTSGTMKQTVSELSVPVPWGEIRGKVWGPDHGRPVLCLHGWADNCGTFNTLIPLLPKDFRYVAMDLPGHGCSSHRPPGVQYMFPSYVMDVRRVVDALQWSKFSIIAHSMGGNIAGMFSAVYPKMVDAIVLVDSFGFLPTDSKELPRIMQEGMDEMLELEKQTKYKPTKVYTYEKAVERLMTGNDSLTEKSAKILLERGLVEVEGGVVFSRDMRLHLKNTVRISLEQSLDFQSRIEASILVILAESGFEKLFAEDEQKKFPSIILQGYRDRNHTVVSVPGSHHVHLNNPEVVAPLVSDFLRSKLLSQSAGSGDIDTSKL